MREDELKKMYDLNTFWRPVAAVCLMATASACIGMAAREIAFGNNTATEALVIDPPVLRVVNSPPSRTHVLRFTAKNSLSGDIDIDSTTTTCGCTIADDTPAHVAPGASITVNVEWTAPSHDGVYESKVLTRWRSGQRSGIAVVNVNGNVTSCETGYLRSPQRLETTF